MSQTWAQKGNNSPNSWPALVPLGFEMKLCPHHTREISRRSSKIITKFKIQGGKLCKPIPFKPDDFYTPIRIHISDEFRGKSTGILSEGSTGFDHPPIIGPISLERSHFPLCPGTGCVFDSRRPPLPGDGRGRPAANLRDTSPTPSAPNSSKKLWFPKHQVKQLQIQIHTVWLVVSTPLTNMKVSWDEIPNIWENKAVMFQENHQSHQITIFP